MQVVRPTSNEMEDAIMPKLVRLYLQSVVTGFVLAVAFTGLLIWLDIAGLGHLIAGSDIGLMSAFLLVFFNGIVFSSVQFGIVVMSLGDDEGPHGGLRDHARMIPVRATSPVIAKRSRRD